MVEKAIQLAQLVTEGLEKHSIGLLGFEDNNPSSLGSGSLVRVGEKRAILTAAHVIQDLPEDGRLGLIVEDRAHNTTIHISSDNLEKKILGKYNATTSGPDLAYILLHEPALRKIPNFKSFYDLRQSATELSKNPLEIDAVNSTWVLVGCPGELMTEADPEGTYLRMFRFCTIKGVGVVENQHIQGEFDYLEFIAQHSASYNGPDSFGGCSGGALWQVQLGMDSTGQIIRKRKILSGVPFWQYGWIGCKRRIKCHGRQSIYQEVVEDLSG